jgi:hypothetical protein
LTKEEQALSNQRGNVSEVVGRQERGKYLFYEVGPSRCCSPRLPHISNPHSFSSSSSSFSFTLLIYSSFTLLRLLLLLHLLPLLLLDLFTILLLPFLLLASGIL